MTTDEHRQRLFDATHPLPGSVPRDQLRPLNVPERFDRLPLLDFLDRFHPYYGRDHWRRLIELGRLLVKGVPTTADRIVRGGERFDQLFPKMIEPEVNPDIEIVHEEATFVVVRKPAPLPTHPCGRFNRNSLSEILKAVYAPRQVHTIHRLDANTAGLMLFGLTKHAAKQIQQQFERREVKKIYRAQVYGSPPKEFTRETRIAETPSEAGARRPDPDGLEARTEFRLLSIHDDGTSLVEARPITGRTNQIRLHLWDAGYPIVGDPVYLRDGEMGRTQTLSLIDPRMRLCAVRLEFAHPESGERLVFETQFDDGPFGGDPLLDEVSSR